MNVRDTEVVLGLLKAEGYGIVDAPVQADVVILNTCSVRQHAEDKVWSEIGRIAQLCKKKINSGSVPIIGLIGCMAQNHKEAAFERSPNIDFVVGPADIDKIPQIIRKLVAGQRRRSSKGEESSLYQIKIWETDGLLRPESIYHTNFYQDKERAYVVISEGCSNFCSYCVVPYVRGSLKHRGHKDIIREIKGAIDKGITAVTLLGQNVNSYQDAKIDFLRLITLVNSIKGLKEFSFITSHPKDASGELFTAMADCKKLKKYLHLPVQSGSDRILKLMNRGYTRKYYLDLVDNYHRIVKDGALTTDIIIGFPTERAEDFKDTYDLVKDIRFNAAFIFKYSPRPQSAAFNMADDVKKEEKEKRHALMLGLQKKISKANVKKLI